MRGALTEMPVALDASEATIRQIDWGGMIVETGRIRQTMDPAPSSRACPTMAASAPARAT